MAAVCCNLSPKWGPTVARKSRLVTSCFVGMRVFEAGIQALVFISQKHFLSRSARLWVNKCRELVRCLHYQHVYWLRLILLQLYRIHVCVSDGFVVKDDFDSWNVSGLPEAQLLKACVATATIPSCPGTVRTRCVKTLASSSNLRKLKWQKIYMYPIEMYWKENVFSKPFFSRTFPSFSHPVSHAIKYLDLQLLPQWPPAICKLNKSSTLPNSDWFKSSEPDNVTEMFSLELKPLLRARSSRHVTF